METKKILHMGDDDSLCWEYEGKKYLAHVQLDEMANDPRNRDTLTIMACFHNMYILGDDLEDKTPEEFWQWLVRENVPEKEIYEAVAAGKLTGLRLDAVADHLYDDLTVRHCMMLMEPYAVWLPLWLYDHSGITMSCGARTGQYADAWDSGYVGWIIAMKDTIMREFGTLTDKAWRQRAIETMESDEGNESKPVALIEFCKDETDLPPCGGYLITRVWDDMDQEGYTSRIVHTGLPTPGKMENGPSSAKPPRFSPEMVRRNIDSGQISFILDPLLGVGTVASIGDHWFYFGGETAEQENPVKFLQNTPMDDLVREVTDALNGLDEDSDDPEPSYYYSILAEKEAA